jgi:hypothetical protein
VRLYQCSIQQLPAIEQQSRASTVCQALQLLVLQCRAPVRCNSRSHTIFIWYTHKQQYTS